MTAAGVFSPRCCCLACNLRGRGKLFRREEMTGMDGLYKLVFYVPTDHAERVKDAVFAVGAGRIGDYDRCCWSVDGTGQFRPLEGSSPFVGNQGAVEKVLETKVEMLCEGCCLDVVLAALLDAHPYETPAYQYWEINT